MYRFYAADISYFSGKVRPALRYKGIHHVELLPDVANVIRPRTGLVFIPIVVTPEDETLQDTSDILDEIERRFPLPALYPSTPLQRIAAFLWELYADEFLLLPAMHYRWSFAESEARARADFAACGATAEASQRFADRMKGSLPFLGISPATIPAIEAHTRDLLDGLCSHFRDNPCLLGGRMSLADCSLLGPLYAHLYNDAVPGRILRDTAPEVCAWIQRANHPDPENPGEWLPNDDLAPTLKPLLELIGRDAVPVILDTVREFERWADAHGRLGEEPPRGVGVHGTRLRGVAFERFTSSYTLWMLQRTLDAWRALDAAERRTVGQALEGSGCETVLGYVPRHRLGKRNFKLVFEKADR
jgi:glutathione S-transferase